jgi:hypothetical protein
MTVSSVSMKPMFALTEGGNVSTPSTRLAPVAMAARATGGRPRAAGPRQPDGLLGQGVAGTGRRLERDGISFDSLSF